MKKARKRALIAGLAIASAVLCILGWNELALVPERASPDEFQLGTVYVGSTVEFSAKFLVSANKHPFDVLFERITKHLPASWAPVLAKVHPKNLRHQWSPVDLTALKPVSRAPAFLRVTKATAEQRKEWYGGAPFVVAEMVADTTHPGKFTGAARIRMGRRAAWLPVSVTVLLRPSSMPNLLIASTPYEAYTTDEGSSFQAVTTVLSTIPCTVDYLRQMPTNIAGYQSIFLADSALVSLKEGDFERLRGFVGTGGHLIFACDSFMWGSVPAANNILTNYGLRMEDRDYGKVGEMITVTNIVSDPLSIGVRRLVFHRPALINIEPGFPGKAVALSPGGEGSFMAVSRLTNGAEVAVLSSSLWWYWVHQFRTNSDNARLLANLLNPPQADVSNRTAAVSRPRDQPQHVGSEKR